MESKGNDRPEEKSPLLQKMEVKVGENFFSVSVFMLTNDKRPAGMTPHYYISKSPQNGALQNKSYTRAL